MREIKFRGKAIDGFWEYGSLWIDKGKYYINGTDNNWWWVIPDTVGQYTGLKDKNGVEIYEGDIVKVQKISVDETIYTAKVKFQEIGRSGWAFEINYGTSENLFYGLQEQRFIEVIGNIYEEEKRK